MRCTLGEEWLAWSGGAEALLRSILELPFPVTVLGGLPSLTFLPELGALQVLFLHQEGFPINVSIFSHSEPILSGRGFLAQLLTHLLFSSILLGPVLCGPPDTLLPLCTHIFTITGK